MELLENIYRNLIISESVGEDEVNDAIDGHKRVIINYHSKGEDKNTGARVVEVYAYGLTKQEILLSGVSSRTVTLHHESRHGSSSDLTG